MLAEGVLCQVAAEVTSTCVTLRRGAGSLRSVELSGLVNLQSHAEGEWSRPGGRVMTSPLSLKRPRRVWRIYTRVCDQGYVGVEPH